METSKNVYFNYCQIAVKRDSSCLYSGHEVMRAAVSSYPAQNCTPSKVSVFVYLASEEQYSQFKVCISLVISVIKPFSLFSKVT